MRGSFLTFLVIFYIFLTNSNNVYGQQNPDCINTFNNWTLYVDTNFTSIVNFRCGNGTIDDQYKIRCANEALSYYRALSTTNWNCQQEEIIVLRSKDYFIEKYNEYLNQAGRNINEDSERARQSSTPAPTTDIDLGSPDFHISKCGLAAAGYQCCYPNLKPGEFSLEGTFFEVFEGVWISVKEFISGAINNFVLMGTGDVKNAVFDSNDRINLCPRSEEGPRKQRFVKLGSSSWLDKEDKYDGNPGSDGQVETQNNSELLAYSTLLTGGTDPATGALKNNGLINTFFNQETLSESGVTHANASYACFCVDPETEINKTPDYFLNLTENESLKNAANSLRASSNQASDLKNRVLSENDGGTGAYRGAHKLCRNISNNGERDECQKCVSGINDSGEIVNSLGGAWTAFGCIEADFSNTLEKTLFPLFIGWGGLVALGCIIYASFLLQTSMGEPEKISKAQELMTSCITGLIMIIFSIFILRVIGVDILNLPGLSGN